MEGLVVLPGCLVLGGHGLGPRVGETWHVAFTEQAMVLRKLQGRRRLRGIGSATTMSPCLTSATGRDVDWGRLHWGRLRRGALYGNDGRGHSECTHHEDFDRHCHLRADSHWRAFPSSLGSTA